MKSIGKVEFDQGFKVENFSWITLRDNGNFSSIFNMQHMIESGMRFPDDYFILIAHEAVLRRRPSGRHTPVYLQFILYNLQNIYNIFTNLNEFDSLSPM